MSLSLFAGGQAEGATKPARKVINLWSFTDEVPKMLEKYKELNPDFDYEINTTIIATTDGAYQPALDQALASSGENAPDIYCAESALSSSTPRVTQLTLQLPTRIWELM
jgi:hypothetical protein